MPNKQLAAALKEKQHELATRINAIEADFHKGRSQDFAEQATETENDDVLDEIHHEAKIELKLVNEALIRLEKGIYGNCSNCDEPINPKRLTALPYTTTCIDCAN
ncbi:TraR/DksA family transcriptional regulator [Litorilituus lipolyticus]|uniref:TraR/DksA family transcriptional regulator n=1 Tax=Litorilituus lipolyticus TaxID=2491017 RepID=A0A502KYF8_9GAMM|nr:TraR/DksA family transcriptional regulator [Litorilituus lipolyticus]TPH13227.1 TraR/DksA family transcriptional regulator [Litorilituus lipolyticus]